MRRALWFASALLGLAAGVALVVVFAFGYSAALTPGPNDEQVDAAFLTFMLLLLLGGGSALAGLAATAVDD